MTTNGAGAALPTPGEGMDAAGADAATVADRLREAVARDDHDAWRAIAEPTAPPEWHADAAALAAELDAAPDALAALAAWREGRDLGLQLVSAGDALAEPEPEPVLWTAGESGDPRDDGALIAVGEAATLTGEGGLGKSAIARDLAVAATLAEASGLAHVETAAGLGVVAAPVLVAGYEDAPRRWARYADAARRAYVEGGVVRVGDADTRQLARGELAAAAWGPGEGPVYGALAAPLYAPPVGHPSAPPDVTAAYRALVAAAERMAARLVVLDPLTACYAGNANDAVSVRGFLARLQADARAGGWGVLLVAHSTVRRRRGEGADAADAISGSHGWWDGSRAVLSLAADADSAATSERGMVLRVIKSNYGRAGWERSLGQRYTRDPRPAWAGLSAPRRF